MSPVDLVKAGSVNVREPSMRWQHVAKSCAVLSLCAFLLMVAVFLASSKFLFELSKFGTVTPRDLEFFTTLKVALVMGPIGFTLGVIGVAQRSIFAVVTLVANSLWLLFLMYLAFLAAARCC